MYANRCLPLLATLGALALAAPAQAAFFDVARLPQPPVSGKEMADNDDAFVNAYPLRLTGTPAEKQAADFLLAELQKEGYQAEIRPYPAAASEPSGQIHAVIGMRKGLTRPDEYLVLEAHYDSTPGATIYGAYDNGSGVQMVRALAKSLARIPTNRTVVIAFYNGEEDGTLASTPMANEYRDTKKAVRAVLGFDMVGIAWPVAQPGPNNCLCMWWGEGDEGFEPVLRHVNFDVLKFPEGDNLVHVVGLNDRNSDEASWDKAGFPTLRWAGMRTAAAYPHYHKPTDTMANLDATAGGRPFFEQGLRNTLLSAYDTALTLDNSMPEAVAAVSGSGPVTFSGAGSRDADGPPSSYVWDFGDGTSGSGVTISHAYARAGVYTARLTVGDNLWPQVTASTSVRVQVISGAGVAPAATKPACKRAKARRKGPRAKAPRSCSKRKAGAHRPATPRRR